jgi:hypothetical protein
MRFSEGILFGMRTHSTALKALLGFGLLLSVQQQQPAAAQTSAPEAAPGLFVPDGSRPYALDVFEGSKELVPIHSSAVQANNHKGSNVVGGLVAGPFYKAKFTTELEGTTARSVLHSLTPTFYVRLQPVDDGGGQSMIAGWAIVYAAVAKDRRLLSTVKFTQFTGTAKRNDTQIDVTIATLADGWLSITPKAPLSAGEYALLPVMRQDNAYSLSVYDFKIDPAAENAQDAIAPAK